MGYSWGIKKSRYMVKWKEGSMWEYWDGQILNGQDPPILVMIISTGLEYSWDDFQKVRIPVL